MGMQGLQSVVHFYTKNITRTCSFPKARRERSRGQVREFTCCPEFQNTQEVAPAQLQFKPSWKSELMFKPFSQIPPDWLFAFKVCGVKITSGHLSPSGWFSEKRSESPGLNQFTWPFPHEHTSFLLFIASWRSRPSFTGSTGNRKFWLRLSCDL